MRLCGGAQGYQYKKPLGALTICGVAMERRHLANHQENECVYRQYTCEHCGYTDTYDAIAGSGWIRNGYSNKAVSGNECAEGTTVRSRQHPGIVRAQLSD